MWHSHAGTIASPELPDFEPSVDLATVDHCKLGAHRGMCKCTSDHQMRRLADEDDDDDAYAVIRYYRNGQQQVIVDMDLHIHAHGGQTEFGRSSHVRRAVAMAHIRKISPNVCVQHRGFATGADMCKYEQYADLKTFQTADLCTFCRYDDSMGAASYQQCRSTTTTATLRSQCEPSPSSKT